MVPTASGGADQLPVNAAAHKRPGHGASPSFKAVSLGDNYIRAAIQGSGLSTTATILLCNTWREGTKQQYNSKVHRRGEFCSTLEIHPVTPISDVVEFLSYLYDNGGWFGVLPTALSTLSMSQVYLSWPTMKGAYNTRPLAPCYVVIWDTDVLLQYLHSLDNTCLDFKLLSCKTAIVDLLTILSGQRVSTIHAFWLSQLQLTTDMVIFNLGNTLLKHSRPGRSNPPIVFHCYPHRRRLCPLQAIRDYVTQCTLLAPQIDKFFITHR